jgi:hypothetical protein
MMTKMKGDDEDRGLALATAGDAFISVWKEPSTLARLERVRVVEQALVDRHAAGIIVLTVMTDSSAATKAGEPEAASLSPYAQSIDAPTLTAALEQARARIA